MRENDRDLDGAFTMYFTCQINIGSTSSTSTWLLRRDAPIPTKVLRCVQALRVPAVISIPAAAANAGFKTVRVPKARLRLSLHNNLLLTITVLLALISYLAAKRCRVARRWALLPFGIVVIFGKKPSRMKGAARRE